MMTNGGQTGFKVRSRAILLPPLIFLVLGFVWSIASPLGSSADADYHSVHIWCAWGDSELCEINPETQTARAPEILVKSNCYVGFPSTVGAGCSNQLKAKLVNTKFNLSDQNLYSPIYFRAMRVFAGDNFALSTHLIRFVNILVAAGLLFWALSVAPFSIRRGINLSWGLAVIPVGIFFIASINPSAWLIPAIGTYWAFLAVLVSQPSNQKRKLRFAVWLGLLTSAAVAIGARTDAIIYILVSTLAVFVWHYRDLVRTLGMRALILLSGAITVMALIGVPLFLNRFSLVRFSLPGAQTSTDQPVPFLKTLIEFPSFFMGLVGAQGPQSGLSTGGINRFVEGYRTSGFYYGIGWMDFNLPSIVGVLIAMSIFAVFFTAIRQHTTPQRIAIAIMVLSIVVVVIFLRARVDFRNELQIQPRYFIPIFLALLGISFSVKSLHESLFSRSQIVLISIFLFVAGSLAWLATATRYAVGPDSAFTNFGQTPEWWWNIGPGRLGWFLITCVVTAVWVYSTFWVWGRASIFAPEQEDNNKVAH